MPTQRGRSLSLIGLAALVAPLSCERARPTPVEDAQLGIRATFPGQPTRSRYLETTTLGDIDWFGFQYTPMGRMDENFHIDVGNLPKGSAPQDPIYSREPGRERQQIGTMTQHRVLQLFEDFLRQRKGAITREALDANRGPGFRYAAPSATGTRTEGLVILRNGRLHHAQVTVKKSGELRLKAFLDSFEVFTPKP